jgi:threonine-phosphate decarboxylase
MSNENVARLFNVRSHNPSFFSVRESAAYKGELLDFCIPVNLHFPPAAFIDLVHNSLDDILRYYPDYAAAHQKNIAEITGLPSETIVPANGSTEIITSLCQHLRGPIVTSIPTFSRWTDLPSELGVALYTVTRRPENLFRLSTTEVARRIRETGARTLIISNPNNPTGACFERDEIVELADELSGLDAIIIDESFIDFSDLKSSAHLVTERPSLIVVKSMGKSLGWHGVRLGYAVTNPARARSLRDTLPFWNINGLAAYVLQTLPCFKDEYFASFALVKQDRSYMEAALSRVPGLTIYPTQANFIYVELPAEISGRTLRDRLLVDYGIMVRECSNKIGSSEQYLRLAVQKKAAVDELVSALDREVNHGVRN